MNISNVLRYTKQPIFTKVFFFFLILLVAPVTISYTFIRYQALNNIRQSLADSIRTAEQDIVYEQGKWNVDKYNANPETSTPYSSSANPLYIITTDGFVIERSKPIRGFLDTADSKFLLQFLSPHTITTPTNEQWRIVTLPITVSEKSVGLVSTLFYNPDPGEEEKIDTLLKESANKIKQKLKFNDGLLSLHRGDIADIPYTISYEVVDSYNKILVTSGRVPSFIDKSYIASQLHSGEKTIIDATTKEKFLVTSHTLTDSTGNSHAIIVTARSLSTLNGILNDYFWFSVLTRIIFTVPLSLFGVYILRRELVALLKGKDEKYVQRISFNNKDSSINLDKEKISIPYSSNQYYLCKAFFSHPHKKWETDELLEKLGDESMSGKSRKIYDAMLAINKKLGIPFVIHEQKRYQINPKYLRNVASK